MSIVDSHRFNTQSHEATGSASGFIVQYNPHFSVVHRPSTVQRMKLDTGMAFDALWLPRQRHTRSFVAVLWARPATSNCQEHQLAALRWVFQGCEPVCLLSGDADVINKYDQNTAVDPCALTTTFLSHPVTTVYTSAPYKYRNLHSYQNLNEKATCRSSSTYILKL